MNRALEYLRASRASEIASMQRLLHTGAYITAISELIHALQRECGVSNIWLCSHGRLFGDQQVRARTLEQVRAMEAFNHIIRTLLNLVFEAADTASEPDISRALIALFSFMQAKEPAGQERATGSTGFAAGAFSAAPAHAGAD